MPTALRVSLPQIPGDRAGSGEVKGVWPARAALLGGRKKAPKKEVGGSVTLPSPSLGLSLLLCIFP